MSFERAGVSDVDLVYLFSGHYLQQLGLVFAYTAIWLLVDRDIILMALSGTAIREYWCVLYSSRVSFSRR